MTAVTLVPASEGSPAIPQDAVEHFNNTVKRAVYLAANDAANRATIYLAERTKPRYDKDDVMVDGGGWLEYTIVIDYASGHRLTVGAIQRKPGEPSEFHS